MVKKTILAALFFILFTTIFGALNTKTEAATSCTTTDGRSGTCTTLLTCHSSSGYWDGAVTTCSGEGCCITYSTTTNVCGSCASCDPANPKVISTAIGCIPTDTSQFISKILGIAVGIGGGIAFLLILFGGFQVLMSAGNPEKLNAGKELVTSAITGLLIIIFSIFILRLIGVNIFGIPEFL
jgi:Type IV secretion system pilin